MVLSLRRVLSVYQQAPNGKNCSLVSLVRYDVDCWRVMICAENQLAFFTPTVCRRVNKSIRFFFVQAFFVVSDTFPRVHCCEVGSKRLHTANRPNHLRLRLHAVDVYRANRQSGAQQHSKRHELTINDVL